MYELTQEDIDKGVPGASNACPIAVCLHRNLQENIEVTLFSTNIGGKHYYNDGHTVNFVATYDSYRKVKPGKVEIYEVGWNRYVGYKEREVL